MGTAIFVVETDNDILLGSVEFVQGGILVRNGFRGHPFFVEQGEVVELTLADNHPLVEQYTIVG